MDPNTPQTTTSDERTWAMIAHLGSVAGMVFGAGTLGWLVPLIVWIVKKDSSRFVAFHALEELLFQIACAVILWASGILAVLTCGVLLPLVLVLAFVPIVWPIIAGIKANNGEWYEYPVVGQMALNNIGMARP